jgi:hypothetical protein
MRSRLTTFTVVTLLAGSAGSAGARPADLPVKAFTREAPAAPSVAIQHRILGNDARTVAPRGESPPAPRPPVTRTLVADDGVNWADVGIGGGLALALVLSASGAAAVRRRHPMKVR